MPKKIHENVILFYVGNLYWSRSNFKSEIYDRYYVYVSLMTTKFT